MKITKFKDIPMFTSIGHYKVDIPLNYLSQTIKDYQQEFNLQLNPLFQRGHVWTEKQQIAYVEFFLRGGKTNRIVYFNNPSWHHKAITEYNDFVCVDGLQRITALLRFVNNEIPAFNSYYKEYTDRPNMTNHYLSININDLQTEKEVLQWYIELNTGGTPHTEQEIEKVRKMLQII